MPVVDCVIAELESRFSQEATSVMSGIQAMTPGSKSFLNTSDLEAFARQYNSNVEDLGHEMHQLRRLLERTEQKSNSPLLGDARFGSLFGAIQVGLCRSLQTTLYRFSAACYICCLREKFLDSEVDKDLS